MRLPYSAFIVLLLTFLLSCDDEQSPSSTQDSETEDDCVSIVTPEQFPPATVSFIRDVQPLLRQHGCASIYCHGGAHAYNVLNAKDVLRAGPQAAERNMCAVDRGNPDNSYLIWKLENNAQISGVSMPRFQELLPQADINILRQWIVEGARDN